MNLQKFFIYRKALDVIEPIFKEFCVVEQGMLATHREIFTFLGLLGTKSMRDEVINIMIDNPTSLTRWEAFVDFFHNQIQLVSIVKLNFL